jgi:hypothetical protein
MLRHIVSASTRRMAALLAVWMALSGLAPAPAAQQPVSSLRIVILEGEGAINNIRQRTAREPIVQVQDENNRPVAGAVVVFTLPDRGASGTFANGARSVTLTTDSQGMARAAGLRPNAVEGDVQIRVDASYQGLTASTTIGQTNVMSLLGAAGAGGGSGKLIAILAIIGGAAAGGAVAATRGSGSSGGGPATPPPTPTSVSLGTPSIGPPR